MTTLHAITKDELAEGSDCQAFVVLVTGQDGEPVYSATLTDAGVWLR